MRYRPLILFFLFIALGLSACAGNGEAEAAETTPSAGSSEVESNVLDAGLSTTQLSTDYEGALPVINQLMLGTLRLEESSYALTPEQAGQLLPFWQALTSDSIQNQVERGAILTQIETVMSPEQIDAIRSMRLTGEQMTAWVESQGLERIQPRQGVGAAGAEGRPERAGAGGFLTELSDEERAEFQTLSPEERRTRLEEMGVEVAEGGGPRGEQAAGAPRPGGGGTGFLMQPLVDLLEQRAGER